MIPFCSFENNMANIVKYQGRNFSRNITDFLKKKCKKGMVERKRMVF